MKKSFTALDSEGRSRIDEFVKSDDMACPACKELRIWRSVFEEEDSEQKRPLLCERCEMRFSIPVEPEVFDAELLSPIFLQSFRTATIFQCGNLNGGAIKQ